MQLSQKILESHADADHPLTQRDITEQISSIHPCRTQYKISDRNRLSARPDRQRHYWRFGIRARE